jgi:FAD/FMN-containing dehydrogenase
MICPEDIDRVPTTSPKTFSNWARAYMFTAATSYRPTTRGQIVEIIRQAEERDRAVKWTGSLWSFMGNFASTSDVVETDDISGVIPFDVLLGHLDLVNPAEARSLVQVRGGTKVYNVNRLLHGLPAASNGGGADENDLDLARGSRALPTLGGSGGQSLAGVLATGSHGGDVHMPPLGDAVAAIHLIGPGGQEWWIERSQGFSRGSETEVQDRLRQAIAIRARPPRCVAASGCARATRCSTL